jgi:nickel transport protein
MLKKIFKNSWLTLAFFPILLSQPAIAHVIWFESNNSEYEVIFGHPEAEREPLIPSRFQEATTYDSEKNILANEITLERDRLLVVPQGNVAALTGFYDNGFWVEYSDGTYENITTEQAEAINYENVTNYLKYGKALYSWSEAVATPFGLPLEIMPLTNPLDVNAGDSLSVQVLYNGTLINDPTVEYLGEEISVDVNGIASIPVGEGGLQVIEASYDDPTANNPGISYAATLTAQTQTQSVPEPSIIFALGC